MEVEMGSEDLKFAPILASFFWLAVFKDISNSHVILRVQNCPDNTICEVLHMHTIF